MKKLILFFSVVIFSLQTFAGHIILDGTYKSNGYYPGTTRAFQVYVPEQYKADKPACLCVMLDGIKFHAPEVLDSLIASGDMPVIIAVFVNPGVIKDAQGNVIRYNRSNEYDMTDDRFAKFLDEGLLPVVEKLKTPDGRAIRLSHDSNDRMITGASSGGIASFVAAWHRPDLFSRVFSAIGTFVSFRGGQDLQAIVRKTEPKALKMFLQDGTTDAWNPLFGSWYEANKMMASALQFSGYDCDFDWSVSGHSGKRGEIIFPQVLKWLWKGWPRRVVPGTTKNDLLSDLLVAGSEWKQCDMSFPTSSSDDKKMILPEGTKKPFAIYPNHSFVAVTMPGTNCLWQYLLGKNGELTDGQRFYWLHTFDNSQLLVADMTFDDNGNLYVLTNAGLQVCDQNGRVRAFINLPPKITIMQSSRILIGDGFIRISVKSGNSIRAFQRIFKIHPAVKSVSPKSQGQG